MPTVVYDHQIFSHQEFGGVSRYFCELAMRVGAASSWRAQVIAPIHYNRYLAQAHISTSGIYLPVSSPRLGKICAKINDVVSPVLSRWIDSDLVHQTYYGAKMGGSSGPFVITVFDMIHELFPAYFSSRDPVPRLKRQLVDAADHVICISNKTAEDLVKVLGVSSCKVSITHLAFSSCFTAPKPDEGKLEPTNRRPYLLYVGKRDGYKNFDRVLAAYASSAQLRKRFALLAFGGGDFSSDELARFTELNLGPDSILHRSGDDVALAEVYAGARAFVYPSEYEGFGIPPLEAMGCGCPVVCSNASSIPEVVGDAGEYFDPLDVDAIRASIESVALDDHRHEALVLAGSRRCRVFSWDRCARETMAVYKKVIEQN